MQIQNISKNPKLSLSAGAGAPLAIPYERLFVGPSLRPNGKMPLTAHAEVGRLLKEVCADVIHRKSMYRSADYIRSTLDEWVMREYPDAKELPREDLDNLYYNTPVNPKQPMSQSMIDEHVDRLRKVITILATHYLDRPPVSQLVRKIYDLIKSLELWSRRHIRRVRST